MTVTKPSSPNSRRKTRGASRRSLQHRSPENTYTRASLTRVAVDAHAGLPGPTPNLLVRILSPRAHLQAFGELASLLVRQRPVTLEMAKREVTTEHAGK